MRRELAVALRAWPTWIAAALAALLVGHGFVLAVDLFSAASRSALAARLSVEAMDPLAGVVRPTLGGLDFALALLGPVVATRVLSAEKERRSFIALCIHSRSLPRVVLAKAAAAACALAPAVLVPSILFAAWWACGAHVDVPETAVASLATLLHMLFVVAVAIAAAAWTRTGAHATALAVAASLASWALLAADDFAALAWLGGAERWSIDRHLAALERGVLSAGDVAWLLAAAAAALGLAVVGAWTTATRRRRAAVAAAVAIVVAAALVLGAADRWRRAWDWTEARRRSLPPAAVSGLRAIDRPITIVVYLDRDDARRKQLESDVLAKLLLARPDATVRTPLDDARGTLERDADYGRVVVDVGGATRETRSTSRREIVRLVFEAAGLPAPDAAAPAYPGWPVVVEGGRRALLVGIAYGVLPGAMLLVGLAATRRRGRR